jgi:Domain of unknown function (DUF4279)
MAHLHRSVATLRIIGDDLVPMEISNMLGCQPTQAYEKGDVIQGAKSGRHYVKKSGMWRLQATDCEPECIDGQAVELLEKLSTDMSVWASLSKRFRVELFCGLFMEESDEGLEASAATLAALGNRGIKLGLCIYGPIQEDSDG